MSGGFFKGTSIDQDARFPDKNKKLLAKMQFPPEYDEKVNIAPIRLELLRGWISKKVESILGVEDEVVVELILNSLESAQSAAKSGKREGLLDPRELQITLTGFLEKQAKPFMIELWKMLVSAGQTTTGIPVQLLEMKKAEILAQKNEQLAKLGLSAVVPGASNPAPSVPNTVTATTSTNPTAPTAATGTVKRQSRFGPPVTSVSKAHAKRQTQKHIVQKL